MLDLTCSSAVVNGWFEVILQLGGTNWRVPHRVYNDIFMEPRVELLVSFSPTANTTTDKFAVNPLKAYLPKPYISCRKV